MQLLLKKKKKANKLVFLNVLLLQDLLSYNAYQKDWESFSGGKVYLNKL